MQFFPKNSPKNSKDTQSIPLERLFATEYQNKFGIIPINQSPEEMKLELKLLEYYDKNIKGNCDDNIKKMTYAKRYLIKNSSDDFKKALIFQPLKAMNIHARSIAPNYYQSDNFLLEISAGNFYEKHLGDLNQYFKNGTNCISYRTDKFFGDQLHLVQINVEQVISQFWNKLINEPNNIEFVDLYLLETINGNEIPTKGCNIL